MRKLLIVLGVMLGLYLVVRAAVEPFVIGPTYHLDWGGPTLAGVLAVHCGPGIVAAALMVRGIARLRWAQSRWAESRRARSRPR